MVILGTVTSMGAQTVVVHLFQEKARRPPAERLYRRAPDVPEARCGDPCSGSLPDPLMEKQKGLRC